MKKLSFFIIAVQLAVLVCFILPSFDVKSNIISLQYSLSELIVFFLLIVFCFCFTKSFSPLKIRRLPLLEYLKLLLLAVFALTVPVLVIKKFFPQLYRIPVIIAPQNTPQKVLVAVSVIIAAAFEEVLYRYFLPESVLYLTGKMNITKPAAKKAVRYIAETVVTALFAAQHAYLGPAGIINAFSAGAAFRLITVRTGSPLFSLILHCLNNFISFKTYTC